MILSTHTFKNNGTEVYNDDVYDRPPFDLKDKEYIFSLQPSRETKFWRFGMAFSKTTNFSFEPSSGRYNNQNLRFIEVDIGEVIEDKWQSPNKIKLGTYYLNNSSSPIYETYDGSEVKLNVRFETYNNLVKASYSTSTIRDEALISMNEYRYFKIFAWSDKNKFQIVCRIEINNYGQSSIKSVDPALAKISTDSPLLNIPDQLEFDSDIEAISKIISYDKVQPPLAIGLFGNWGTGKSFFINKLQEKIIQYSSLKNSIYCHDIVHVKFNSWYYSDSNLWASLITKILDELNRYGKSKEYSLKELFENLNTTKELIEQSKLQLKRIGEEKEALEKNIAKIEEEIKAKSAELDGVKKLDIAIVLWQSPLIQDKIKELKKMFPGKTFDNIRIINEKAAEFRLYAYRFLECLKIMYKFKTGKRRWLLIIPGIVFLFVFLITSYFRNGAQFLFDSLALKITLAATLLTHLSQRFIPAYGVINNAYQRLQSIEQTYANLEEASIIENTKQKESIYNDLEAKKEQYRNQEKKLDELKSKETILENEIEDIASGKNLKKFIENRVSDERYINSLGIISWIRKDFEELDYLLKIQHEASDEEIKKLGKEKHGEIFKIDRIILYIDDLDRCNEDNVVRLLEAIHLLLAFPLFIVIVGVDQRWVHRALDLKYEKFFNNKAQIVDKNDTGDTEKAQLTTSFDYLEKIFQIPFALAPINTTGKNNLIAHQLGVEINSQNINKTSSPSEETANVVDPTLNAANSVAYQELPILKSLVIGEPEIKFLQEISFLIGDSPRTINRYINIYRIIRTHPKFVITEEKQIEYFCAAMLMLGIITGMPHISKKIFNEFLNEQNDTTFRKFISGREKKEMNFGGVKVRDPDYNLLYDTIEIKIGDIEFGDVEINRFKSNMNLISRFSFRNLL
jgi:hypothetical protein